MTTSTENSASQPDSVFSMKIEEIERRLASGEVTDYLYYGAPNFLLDPREN